jgi:hypothetical protein
MPHNVRKQVHSINRMTTREQKSKELCLQHPAILCGIEKDFALNRTVPEW